MAPSLDVLPASDPMAVMPMSSPEEYYSDGLRARFRMDAEKAAARKTAQKTQPTPEGYADIGYELNEQAYLRRSKARQAQGGLLTTLPHGFPAKLEEPLVWSNGGAQDESEFIYWLSDSDKEEIDLALEYFKKQGLDGQEVSRETFPLPSLGKRLDMVCDDVYDGRGFVIVRGLDPDFYEVEDMTVIYLGISSYIAERRGRQDQRRSVLMHVILRNDENQDRQSSEDKPFHTDTVNDCLCLFTQSLAASGGRSVLASAWTVYNELAATRPDLIHVLSQPDWPFDTSVWLLALLLQAALMYYHDNKLITSFSRRLLVGHAPSQLRTPGIPGLTEAQAEALDAVHFVARKHEIKPTMCKGDLRFMNNMAILHRREAFSNDSSTGRHLVRVWLNNELRCWKLPYDLRLAWARVFDDDDADKHWELEPLYKNGKILRVAGSCD